MSEASWGAWSFSQRSSTVVRVTTDQCASWACGWIFNISIETGSVIDQTHISGTPILEDWTSQGVKHLIEDSWHYVSTPMSGSKISSFNTSHLDASLIVFIYGNGFEPKARYWKTRGDRLRRLSSRTTLEWSYDDVRKVIWRLLPNKVYCWAHNCTPSPSSSSSSVTPRGAAFFFVFSIFFLFHAVRCQTIQRARGPVEDGQVLKVVPGATWICRFSRMCK
jgi:hypothetical protein